MDLRGKQRHDTDFGCVVASARPTNVLSQVFSHGVEWRTPDRATVVSLSLSLSRFLREGKNLGIITRSSFALVGEKPSVGCSPYLAWDRSRSRVSSADHDRFAFCLALLTLSSPFRKLP